MTIENSSVIDAAGIDKETGSVVLSIFAHMPWDRESLLLLEEKINRYLGFIESGEIFEAYPAAQGRPRVIEIYCHFRPTDETLRFLDAAFLVAKEYGSALQYTHAGQGYLDDAA
ncbi:DUF6572 domain-containing protein [Herbaspirillum sp. NPDC101397]|uniref:DUF6572 domain-containing protein n=1 Tax=Herbaspirillum sp. NPDC101397 TaxID=3364006 RepID=UPI00383BD10E